MDTTFIRKVLNATISEKHQKIGIAFKKHCGQTYNTYCMFLFFLFREEIEKRSKTKDYFNQQEIEMFLNEHINEKAVVSFINQHYCTSLTPTQESRIMKFISLLDKFNNLSFFPTFTQIGESSLKKITKIYRNCPRPTLVWDEKNEYHPSTLFG